MKKFTCMMLALLLCLTSVAALAESVPSKTTADLRWIEADTEKDPEDSGFYIRIVTVDETNYQERVEICTEEIAKLAAAESVEAYFGEELDLKSIVGADELNVFEYVPIIAGGYDIAYGTVTTKIWLATPYEVDEKVAVMIGMVTENADGTNTVSWKAFEGVGIAPESEEAVAGIQTELDPETVLAIQEGVALLAIVSDCRGLREKCNPPFSPRRFLKPGESRREVRTKEIPRPLRRLRKAFCCLRK